MVLGSLKELRSKNFLVHHPQRNFDREREYNSRRGFHWRDCGPFMPGLVYSNYTLTIHSFVVPTQSGYLYAAAYLSLFGFAFAVHVVVQAVSRPRARRSSCSRLIGLLRPSSRV